MPKIKEKQCVLTFAREKNAPQKQHPPRRREGLEKFFLIFCIFLLQVLRNLRIRVSTFAFDA